MRWIDGHLDLAYLQVCGADVRAEAADPSTRCVSLPALRSAGVDLCLATIFTEPGASGPEHPHGYASSDDLDGAEAAGLRQLEVYERWEAEGEISVVRSGADLEAAGPLPRIVILMEGADPIRSPEHAERWHGRGVRIVGMAWAAGTRYAGGNSAPPHAAPAVASGAGGPPRRAMAPPSALTPRGVELIAALDELGIIHDASHLSDAAFDGLLERARGPVIASHSNCRALLEPWQRHLRDDQMKAIGARGGIVGLNLYSEFLVDRAAARRATIADCIAHVEHVAAQMGHRRGVGLGSDMDGGFSPGQLPEELDHPAKLPALSQALRSRGWPEREIAGFEYDNWMRFLKGALTLRPPLAA